MKRNKKKFYPKKVIIMINCSIGFGKENCLCEPAVRYAEALVLNSKKVNDISFSVPPFIKSGRIVISEMLMRRGGENLFYDVSEKLQTKMGFKRS